MEISGSPSWDDLVLISYLGQWVLMGDISGIASTKTRGRPKKATASPKEEELAEVVAEEDENIVDDDIEGTGLVGMVEPVDLFGEEPGELEIGGLELGGDEEDGLDLFAEMDEDGVEEIHLEELTGELGEPANEPVAPKEEAGVEEEEEDITVDLGKTKILPSSFLLSKVLKPRNPQIFGQQYARKCAATDGRQPLILTRRQLLDVIATNPASLGYNKTIEGHDGEVTPELMKTW